MNDSYVLLTPNRSRDRSELYFQVYNFELLQPVTTPSSFVATMSGADQSRRRRPRSPSPEYKLDEVDDSYEPYVPVAQRRQAKLAKLSTLGVNSEKSKAKQLQEALDEKEDAQREEERRREKARKERTLLLEAQEVHLKKATEGVEFSTL